MGRKIAQMPYKLGPGIAFKFSAFPIMLLNMIIDTTMIKIADPVLKI
jgi:hypothetical protein